MIENRLLVAWRWDGRKGFEEVFGGDGDAYHIDDGNGFMGWYICQTLKLCSLFYVNYIYIKLLECVWNIHCLPGTELGSGETKHYIVSAFPAVNSL